ncbi:uncharacterized protein LOC123709930 [Pieris brassicae]|uniref:Uncharacterized protein n=1 Tax=Pieris brassicae TaxID=7116 RepID=A0A9P0TF39_PIEBR|nr:uncharacterized protein LOC123709930 [Pieris brassicae]CAH4027914.1 unnamed protein product [Pieris brassicae]
MSQYVLIVAYLMVRLATCAPSPLQMTIECGSDENRSSAKSKSAELSNGNTDHDMDSFCNLIQKAIPKAIEDGKFIIEPNTDNDLIVDSNNIISSAVSPPSGFIPRFSKPKISKLKIPRLNSPRLKPLAIGKAPKVGAPMKLTMLRKVLDEETSAERMERFKNGVQKMLHVVKVLGQIDQYLSERTRIVIDKLSKTFME